MTSAEHEICARGFATVGTTDLLKYIIERKMSDVGSASRAEIMKQIDKSNEAIAKLRPKISWVESFTCDGWTFCVYLADSLDTQEVQSVIDPYVA